MKVIILKSKHNKSIIGFAENTEAFVNKWLKDRQQYSIITATSTENRFELKSPVYDGTIIYGSELKDGETCWISCDDNLMGFNDNH